ncbi:MAG TPA: nucleoside 2-deoxyribosyltransferase [Pyrinomonadaceae bacterium]|nr:nucleoside 2-deoxyribosyltransferase [Pyrinomonadaceae bacterium]
MKIYFSGSVSGGREDVGLYHQIILQLKQHGLVLTEHIGDERLDARGEPGLGVAQIHDRDLAWLRQADCLVAEVTTPSLGVGYEIGKATEWGKSVLCLFRTRSGSMLSPMIAGSNGAVLREYRNVGELKEIFDEFFKAR